MLERSVRGGVEFDDGDLNNRNRFQTALLIGQEDAVQRASDTGVEETVSIFHAFAHGYRAHDQRTKVPTSSNKFPTYLPKSD